MTTPSSPPPLLETVAQLRNFVALRRAAQEHIALVPTMGALHEGHLSLVRLAREQAKHVIVSIFVNPTQFAQGEDFDAYPRTLKQDIALLETMGVDAIFHPAAQDLYPESFATSIQLKGPALTGLEDQFRPTHFSGVALVVLKLLLACQPDIAVFGEKDYQQLKVIERLVIDLDIPVKILGAPIVREKDGLALSSRNRYLTPEQRAQAALFPQILQQCVQNLKEGRSAVDCTQTAIAQFLQSGIEVDYLELRDSQTLQPVTFNANLEELRLLAAVRIGPIRLLDNFALL